MSCHPGAHFGRGVGVPLTDEHPRAADFHLLPDRGRNHWYIWEMMDAVSGYDRAIGLFVGIPGSEVVADVEPAIELRELCL